MVKVLGSEDETRSLLGLDSLSPDSMMVKGIDEELRKVLPEGVGDAEQAFFAKLVHFRGERSSPKCTWTCQTMLQAYLRRFWSDCPKSLITRTAERSDRVWSRSSVWTA